MTETQLFTSPLFTVTEFACPPGDEAWASSNLISSAAPLIVFPRRAVGIRPANGRRVLATPNLVMLYNPAQEYERELHDRRGDHCLYFTIHDRAASSLERDARVLADGRMTATHVPSTHGTYLRQHVLARYLRSERVDPLVVDETVWMLASDVLGRLPASSSRRGSTSRAHYELTEAAKERIVASISETLGLAELAAQLDVSPFHLARIFRAQTGFALHQYRKHLRLRLALEGLEDKDTSLSTLAFDLGFASHSHFTDTFRREFGVAPSTLRGDAALRLLAS